MSVEIRMIKEDSACISFDDARKRIRDMNLINGFMMDSVLEDEEKGKEVIKGIVDTVLEMDIPIEIVRSQKVISGLDTVYHGIRFDVYIGGLKDNNVGTTIYDLEMEDREADKEELPKRGRYYQALCDSKTLATGKNYNELPDYVAITILSYDPFGAGDLYYEVNSTITTHPNIFYKDGIRRIFLYGKGKNNLSNKKRSKEIVS